MSSFADFEGGEERKSARAKRKAKEKANARKRAAAGNVLDPYAALEGDEATGAGEEEDAEPAEVATGGGRHGAAGDDTRPKTSHSDASGDTLIGAQDANLVTSTSTPLALDVADTEELPKTTASEWAYDELPDISDPAARLEEDPDEPLTEAEIRHKDIADWLEEKKGHAYNMKRVTREKLIDFVYDMKYGEDRAEWVKELRLIVWRAAVRASFWWINPDTNEPALKPAPISAPTGAYEGNFPIFVACAAERLDRIGRDLPDPEYVQQIESAIRTFFRRVANKKLHRALEHFAFLLLMDEEQNRHLTREALQSRLRMCFEGVKGMEWGGLGMFRMGERPTRRMEPPLRTELVWEEVVGRFGL